MVVDGEIIVTKVSKFAGDSAKKYWTWKTCSTKCMRILAIWLVMVVILMGTWYYCVGNRCTFGSVSYGSTRSKSLSSVAQRLRQIGKALENEAVSNGSSQFRNRAIDQEKWNREKLERTEKSTKHSDFDISKSDVIVFLHIQNTGGNVFARHLVEDLVLDKPCVCKKRRRLCQCFRPNKDSSNWLFSRYTMGWKCGVHPDWTELSSCVDRILDEEEGIATKRRYFFITLLRDPVTRFLSEYWHVRQGQSWRLSRHYCGGREASPDELPSCFNNKDLERITMDEFLSCRHNLAINRQTRMLADLSLVGCYNTSIMPQEERDLVMLASAKTNLHKMAFFGLAEFPKISEYMFEETFGISFTDREFHGFGGRAGKRSLSDSFSAQQIEKVKEANRLDMDLYQYSKDLLFYRFEILKKHDPSFENNFEVVSKSKISNVNWAEKEDFIENLLQ